MKQVALYIALAAIAAGCASQDAKRDAPVTDRSGTGATPPSSATAPSTTTRPSQPGSVAGNPLRDPSNILSKRSVYFDYDSNAVKDEFRGLVQAHARYLAEQRDARARIEGHCDERGSREYNLALGQRRAEAVKKVMTVLGAADARIETVSYGEEKPVATGHDEKAWSQNRRADIKYAGE
ncbi:MAG TPA: peptidoglycan-associated lipoprotein Pal [Usitatibacter sp.]|nr:peptidoglycan-associated lipoprotein Pal [Usitatibacter sp.]